MTTTRLTNDARVDIKKAVLRAAFMEPLKAISAKMADHAHRVYMDVIPEAQLKQLMKIERQNLIHTDDDMVVVFGDRTTRLYFNGFYEGDFYSMFNGYKGTGELFPSVYRYYNHDSTNKPTYSARHKFSVEYFKLHTTRKALEDQFTTLRNQIAGTLSSVPSVKKLREVWPEVDEFLPEYLTSPQKYALTVPVTEINKTIATLRSLVEAPTEEKATQATG